MAEELFILTLISGVFVAAASGLVGSFLVLRKMTLLSDALSHIALPGIALGILLHFEPIIGGLLFLFLGVLVIWQIQNKTRLAIESVTGVFFVTALAVGAMLIPKAELLEAFFGDVTSITLNNIIIQTAIAFSIIGAIAVYFRSLVLISVAPDLAKAAKIREAKIELLLLVLIALTIVIGISFVGILLMSAISIVPAATARNLAKNFKSFVGLSVLLAIFSLTAGLFIGESYGLNPSIATVLASAFVFTLSLFYRKKNQNPAA